MGKTLRLAKNTDFKSQNGTNLPVIKDAVSSTIRYTPQTVDGDELRLSLIIWVTTQGAIFRVFKISQQGITLVKNLLSITPLLTLYLGRERIDPKSLIVRFLVLKLLP